MRLRNIMIGLATAALGTLGVGSVALAQDPTDETTEPAPVIEARTGTVTTTTDADGDVEYLLDGVELGVGPHWFYDVHPLDGLDGMQVTVTGEVDDGIPDAQADDRANADGGPSFDALTVNDTVIRTAGEKPGWAGGPAVVGESHPGYAGWSRGRAASGGGEGNGE